MATQFGTNDTDRLIGTSDSDALFGNLGDDLLAGGGGDDFLDGGDGADQLDGGDGNDVLFAGAGDDLILTGTGRDFVDAGAGDDRVLGGDDSNVIFGGSGNDRVFGGAGDDFISGDEGTDSLVGGSGSDLLFGGAGSDNLDGGVGDDLLFGDDGNDNIRGGNGRDLLFGGAGIDAILGEAGDDQIFAGDGNDSVDGDSQLRFYLLGADNTVVVVDPGQLGQSQTLRIAGLPAGVQLQGIDRRPADNLLYSVGTDNRIYNLDVVSGAATVVSTLNSPFFEGATSGVGFDFNPVPNRLRLVADTDRNFRINVDTGLVADNDAIAPGIQADGPLRYLSDDSAAGQNPTIVAVAYTNNVAGATSTILYGIDSDRNTLIRFDAPNAGTLRTVGSLGFDVAPDASFDILSDFSGAINVAVLVSNGIAYQVDLVTGQSAALGAIGSQPQSFRGFTIALVPDLMQSGDDAIFGGNGDDVLNGNLGNDAIYGESGNDRILGGSGDDLLVGGDGVDAFIFQSIRSFQSSDFGRDVILDFQAGVDKLVLSQTSFGPLTAASLAIVADDGAVEGSSGAIVYSQGSGQLFYNQNGSGTGLGTGAVLAQLNGSPTLSSADFVFS
jgi:Ca2+-binding RTX toxin-like protein